ncbi:unnamed protein product, partial [Ectocarpus fasciculatus]
SRDEGVAAAARGGGAGAAPAVEQQRGGRTQEQQRQREERADSGSSAKDGRHHPGGGGRSTALPPSHDNGHKPLGKHKSGSLASSRTHGFAPPPHPDETGRGTSTPASASSRPWLESDPSLSSAHEQQQQQQQQRSRSPSDELHGGGKGSSQLLARGRMHFNTGSGGTSHMFASSPKGVRAAARRARSFQRHASASSVWAAQSDAAKREDSMLKSLAAERGVVVESPTDAAAEEVEGGAAAVEEVDGVGGEGVGPAPPAPRPKEALSPSSRRAAVEHRGG